MKKIYVVYSIQQGGKRYAIADSIRVGENLLAHCYRNNAEICHLCETRQQAEQLAIEWNNSYKENGTSIFL